MKLADVPVKAKLSQEQFKRQQEELAPQLGRLQREMRSAGRATLIVFEGWDAAGKGTCINRLLQPMDPRGFRVRPIIAPTREEALRPWLWRYWLALPPRGQVRILERSWYRRVLDERLGLEKPVPHYRPPEDLPEAFEEINAFERQLAEDGLVLVKLFLHIPRGVQGRRQKALRQSDTQAWKVSPADRRQHRRYAAFAEAADEAFARTDHPYAPWHVIPATDVDYASIEIQRAVVGAWQRALGEGADAKTARRRRAAAIEHDRPTALALSNPLEGLDLAQAMPKDDYKRELKRCRVRLRELQDRSYMARLGVVIVFEGWDAGGKGGTIRRLTSRLDPRGYDVSTTAAPTDEEKAHQYLWRFWRGLSKRGHFTIFDRSWYGRVLVERVEGFAQEPEWRRAYGEINEFERALSSDGYLVLKFWMQIDAKTQLERFQARQEDATKQWKITEEDWRNREKWPQYEQAAADMIARTSTERCPWTVVEANDKRFARIKVMRTVIDALDRALPGVE